MFISDSHIHVMFIQNLQSFKKQHADPAGNGSDRMDRMVPLERLRQLQLRPLLGPATDSGSLRMTQDQPWHVLTFIIILHIFSYFLIFLDISWYFLIFLDISSFSISEESTRPAVLPLCWPKVPVSQNSSQTAEGLWRLMKAYEGFIGLPLVRLRGSSPHLSHLSHLLHPAKNNVFAMCKMMQVMQRSVNPFTFHSAKLMKLPHFHTFSSVRVIFVSSCGSSCRAVASCSDIRDTSRASSSKLAPPAVAPTSTAKPQGPVSKDHPKHSKTDMNMSYAVIYIFGWDTQKRDPLRSWQVQFRRSIDRKALNQQSLGRTHHQNLCK